MLDYQQVNTLNAQWMGLYARLAEETVKGSSEKGAATVVLDGHYRAVAVELDPAALGIEPAKLPPDAIARLQQELVGAFNQALDGVGEVIQKLARSVAQEEDPNPST